MPHVKHELSTTPEHTSVHSYFRASEMKKARKAQAVSSSCTRLSDLRNYGSKIACYEAKYPSHKAYFLIKLYKTEENNTLLQKKNIYTIVVDLYSLQSFLFLFKFHIKNLQNPRLNQTNHMVLRMNRK